MLGLGKVGALQNTTVIVPIKILRFINKEIRNSELKSQLAYMVQNHPKQW